MTCTTRVRIAAGPWPARIGCVGTIVEAPAGYDRYPWDKPDPRWPIVLLDNDPLGRTNRACCYGGQAWTWAIARDDLEVLDA